ncbi:non-structural maintenance of chromosomes element 4 [Sphingobium nicotianae]|nr:non-structural maintenance of chromosomes element 4 [Sphingobium nicotianae]
MSGQPMEIDMRTWKKLIAAYIAAAGNTGPFVIGSFY